MGPTSATHAGSATCASLLPLVHFPFHPAPLCAILHIICRHLHLEGLCEHKDRTLLPAAFVRPLPSAVVAVVAVAMHGPWPSPSRAANARARERSVFPLSPMPQPRAIGHRPSDAPWILGSWTGHGLRSARSAAWLVWCSLCICAFFFGFMEQEEAQPPGSLAMSLGPRGFGRERSYIRTRPGRCTWQ